MNINNSINNVINDFNRFKEVQAIAIGGSSASSYADKSSDIDVYVFVDKDIPVEKRLDLVKQYSTKYEVGCEYFGSGDEFLLNKDTTPVGKQLDVMYFNKNWFEDNFNNVWLKHLPSNGYTTCFLYTLSILNIVKDKTGWLNSLKEKLKTPYPKELKENIITRNLNLMMDKPFASYYEQLEKAVKRNDLNSINHRITAFLASYFDIIFAKNELLHPGEKRLVNYALEHCKTLPEEFEANINKLILDPNKTKLETAKNIVNNLRKIL